MPVEPTHPSDLLPHLASLLTEVPLESPVALGIRLMPDTRSASSPSRTIVVGSSPPGSASPIELLFRHLDCADVVCALCGFTAPSEWDVFGVIAPGRGLWLDEPTRPADAVTACALVDRAGRVVSRIRAADGSILSSGPAIGRVVDACHRALGLATPPAVCAPAVWLVLRWIDRVLSAVLDADLGEPPSWPALDALDPLDAVRAPEARGAGASPSWHRLRTACACGGLDVPGIVPCAAAWMDDGMFAREAIAAFAPLTETLTDLRALLPAPTFDKIVERVSARLGA